LLFSFKPALFYVLGSLFAIGISFSLESLNVILKFK